MTKTIWTVFYWDTVYTAQMQQRHKNFLSFCNVKKGKEQRGNLLGSTEKSTETEIIPHGRSESGVVKGLGYSCTLKCMARQRPHVKLSLGWWNCLSLLQQMLESVFMLRVDSATHGHEYQKHLLYYVSTPSSCNFEDGITKLSGLKCFKVSLLLYNLSKYGSS